MRPPAVLSAVRPWANRLLVAVALLAALPAVVVAARLRPNRARAVALAAIRSTCRLAGVHIEIENHGGPPGGKPRLYVANHSSPLDIAAMLVARPDSTFVAAADLFRIPLLAGAMRALGTVPVDRRSHGRARLEIPPDRAGPDCSLIVFPEGAIPPAGHRLAFKHGAFAAAIELGAVIVPVAIHHTARVLPPRSVLGVRPGHVVVELLDPIATDGSDVEDRAALARRAETCILAALGPEDGGRASS